MALVAFVPFTILVLTSVGWQDKLVFTLCLQTVAANAGGMLTPFGNAQNLYLFSFYNMSVGHFFAICLPTVAVAILVIILLVILKPSGNIKINFPRKHKLHNKKLFCLYCILFLICILCVFRVLPWYIMLATVTLCVFVFDREAILRIDWLFLVTLCLFFV
ncbi:MAG: citrate transporter, partial [Oscillospiraceae bacterium]